MKNAFRWLGTILLPAIAAIAVAFAIIAVLTPFAPAGSTMWVTMTYIDSILSAFVAVVLSAKLAPKGKRLVAFIWSGFFMLASFGILMSSERSEIVAQGVGFLLGGVGGFIFSCWRVYLKKHC